MTTKNKNTCPNCSRPLFECPACENETYCDFCAACKLGCNFIPAEEAALASRLGLRATVKPAPKMSKADLTEYESKILDVLFESSAANGHDFGFIEDLRGPFNMRQARGAVSSLVKKDWITVHDAITNESGTWTQFTFNDEARAVLNCDGDEGEAETSPAPPARIFVAFNPASKRHEVIEYYGSDLPIGTPLTCLFYCASDGRYVTVPGASSFIVAADGSWQEESEAGR